jgi:uncharacterized membrane protein YedE/YeeE
MENFTPLSALLGGAMIGAAAAMLLVLDGRIAGISGIVGGLMRPVRGEIFWRLAFIAGLVLAPLAWAAAGGPLPTIVVGAPAWLVIVAGLLVGFGSRLGSGCTSGHGVCGIGRASPRSLVATAVFMATAVATVFVTRHLLGL